MGRPRACEDCGEDMPQKERRFRCHNCGLLCCGWCIHHVHRFAATMQRKDQP